MEARVSHLADDNWQSSAPESIRPRLTRTAGVTWPPLVSKLPTGQQTIQTSGWTLPHMVALVWLPTGMPTDIFTQTGLLD